MLIHRPKTELTLLDSLSTTESNSDLQKAWHLLSLLLSIGHLTSPHELASLCTLFPTTPDLVEFLCSIPHSPLTLTTGNEGILVTISVIGLLAFCRFASNFNLADAFLTPIRDHSPGKLMTDAVRVYFRKRKRIQFDSLEVDKKLISVSGSAKRVRNDSSKVHFHVTEHIRSMYVEPSFMSIKLNNIILPPNLFIKAIANKIIYQLEENVEQVEDEMDKHMILVRNGNMDPELDEESACQRIMLDSTMDIDDISFKDGFGQTSIVSLSCANADDACNAENDCFIAKIGVQCREFLTDSANMKEVESLLQPINTALLGASRESESKRKKETTSLDKERLTSDARKQTISPSTQLESVGQKQLSRPSAKMKLTFLDAISLREKATEQFSEGSKAVTTLKENLQVKRNIMAISTGQKPKQKHVNAHIKEGKKDLASFSPTDQVQTKALPCFESYIVEEEEGSGGYGTVYRARRKIDGTTVAIKCPHENAHRHHVSNELRMLERFGGKNYIIKLEGCLKSGNSDCFVLEHIEHDRPELLKKDIDLSQLRWYGYCMFRALASLHKQGIVHRDVKPGNFLFSRKSNKGHLIDFNLAMDLRQKYGTTNKLKTGNDVSVNRVTLPNAKPAPTKSRRIPVAKFVGAVNREATKGLKATLELKNQKRRSVNRPKADNELSGWNIMRSQGADGSGITSVKDVTSNRTPSAERPREPLPCQGRKELLSLLQEAMHSPTYEASSVPASIRKRIAAPHGKVDERLIYLTPMPLNSTELAIPGKSLSNNKDAKPKKEGPCVGTKGFRAPEVLFRSTYQGPKIDIWSAGVTLLYLMIGRTPFYGDPEQNIKDIAKLKGSEDLWEVAKLHDRESSFPAELYDKYLPSVTLREWCKINTKRRDFYDIIPNSLIDLVNKCLTVNPRLRISAEDALKHEFFAPCHEGPRKQRPLRQELSLDSGASLPLCEQSIENGVTVKISHQLT
ncbi:serine/threonine-protein kinase RIM15 isoform X2 [Ricinus communis]|uniref:serine/threonine-protein kinase RIM15 isoform X2 n=1 Tax=Ricinus communis TaxID=3988 RepID=UPI0007726EDF|nr:serine/threonine-protein kinase RIM15 isoform X2 [Ricinus communis]|eukprot:XP_015582453.1 serine/threonine-protein kinase RIM15 isoform X2 [Ricinus communis]